MEICYTSIHFDTVCLLLVYCLFTVCSSDMALAHVELGLRSQMDKTTWMTHLVTILQGARRIASEVDSGITCVVHCSDGWDRTSQLTSLPMLFLDPYYRTITGFQVLIEKEWLSFGHKFAVRSGADTSSLKTREDYLDKQRSPIFVQFLDCVWQIKKQFNHYFEFNDNFLIACLRHVYSGRYGTFLFDTERERMEHGLKTKTISLWTEMNIHRAPFINDDYDPVSTMTVESGKTMYTDLQVEIPLLSLWPAYEELWRQGVVGEVGLGGKGARSGGGGGGGGAGKDGGGGKDSGGGGDQTMEDYRSQSESTSSNHTRIPSDDQLTQSKSVQRYNSIVPELPPRTHRKHSTVQRPVLSQNSLAPSKNDPSDPSGNSGQSGNSAMHPQHNQTSNETPTAPSVSSPPPRPKSKAPDANSESRQSSLDSLASSPPPRPTSKAPDASEDEEVGRRGERKMTDRSCSTNSIPERPSILQEKPPTRKRQSVMKRRETADDDVFDFA